MSKCRIILLIHALIFSLLIQARADAPRNLKISLITCSPGQEIFELYGHEAVRVQGEIDGRQLDLTINYGLFDFDSPGFIARFVKGETDYMSAAMPTPYFLAGYAERGSAVKEYTLNLSEDEAQELWRLLHRDCLPENSTYRYKYFSNNCATRPLSRLEQVVGKIEYNSEESETYRELLEHYNAGYPWYQLGIDLALGSGIDKPMSMPERMFNPMELSKALPKATRQDGCQLVEASELLVEGREIPRNCTPWYLSPIFVLGLLSALSIVACFCLKGFGRKIIYGVWGVIFGLAGALVWYLAFVSVHEGASPNMLVIWLNPFWLLLPFTLGIKVLHKFNLPLLCLQVLAAIATVIAAFVVGQKLNPALYSLLLLTVSFPISFCASRAKS